MSRLVEFEVVRPQQVESQSQLERPMNVFHSWKREKTDH